MANLPPESGSTKIAPPKGRYEELHYRRLRGQDFFRKQISYWMPAGGKKQHGYRSRAVKQGSLGVENV
jgi:hypothetical protein